MSVDLSAGAPGEEDEIVIHAGMTPWQKATAFFGPGLLIATVYIDPGQIVVDMETGSAFQYRMLWVGVVDTPACVRTRDHTRVSSRC